MATVDDVDISSVIWKDNKNVTMFSTFASKIPVRLVLVKKKEYLGRMYLRDT